MGRLLNKIVPILTQYAKNVFIWLITSSSNRISALLFAWCINQQYRFEVYVEGGRLHTVWKLENFSVAQILREIKFWNSRSLEFAIWAHLATEFWLFMTFWRLKFTKSTKLRAPKMAKMAVLELLKSPKLISRKIWVAEKSWNVHTVLHITTARNEAPLGKLQGIKFPSLFTKQKQNVWAENR